MALGIDWAPDKSSIWIHTAETVGYHRILIRLCQVSDPITMFSEYIPLFAQTNSNDRGWRESIRVTGGSLYNLTWLQSYAVPFVPRTSGENNFKRRKCPYGTKYRGTVHRNPAATINMMKKENNLYSHDEKENNFCVVGWKAQGLYCIWEQTRNNLSSGWGGSYRTCIITRGLMDLRLLMSVQLCLIS